jgi:excisionase family DNA binding protein
MSETLLDRSNTIVPSEEDALAARDSSRLFAGLKTNGQKSLSIRVESEGDEVTIPIPLSLFRLLSDVLTNMARGNAVTIVPLHAELTTYQAADFLNVSRPFVIQLIEAGKLPYRKVGTHRRILFADLLEFKRKSDADSLQALKELTREAQELGLGY